MKAAQMTTYGSPDVIAINETAKPSAQPGQVVVAVKAASLNRIDTAIRAGYLQQMLPLQLPATLGGDFAGVVSEVGEGVTNLRVGDEVYGNAGAFKGGSGSLAEFVAGSADNVARKPTSLDFTQAAALPLVATSALQGIMEHIQLKEGQRILIHGGAGGVGSIAVQLAKLAGAYVITTVSKNEMAFAQELGADEVLDYQAQDFTKVVANVDAVFDTVGGDVTNQSLSVLKKGGVLVSMAGQPDQEKAKECGVTALSQMTAVSRQQLQKIAELVDSGKLTVHIEKVFALTQAKEAFDYFETKQPKGKIMVEVS